jgi:hypothetical protein
MDNLSPDAAGTRQTWRGDTVSSKRVKSAYLRVSAMPAHDASQLKQSRKDMWQ